MTPYAILALSKWELLFIYSFPIVYHNIIGEMRGLENGEKLIIISLRSKTCHNGQSPAGM